MQPRISMVALAVADIETARTFYEDGLGLPRAPGPPEPIFFALNGTWLGLSERGALAKDMGISGTGSGFGGISLAHNVASEAEVDALLAKAKTAGAQILKPATRADWGGYYGYFQDPDGHIWEVAHNPFFWIGPEDPG